MIEKIFAKIIVHHLLIGIVGSILVSRPIWLVKSECLDIFRFLASLAIWWSTNNGLIAFHPNKAYCSSCQFYTWYKYLSVLYIVTPYLSSSGDDIVQRPWYCLHSWFSWNERGDPRFSCWSTVYDQWWVLYEQGTRLALLPEKVVVANDANA